MLSGRAARRRAAQMLRRKGAGWTRQFRKGRTQRHPVGVVPTAQDVAISEGVAKALEEA